MPVRRVVMLSGITISVAFIAFGLGGWWAQRAMAQQLANNDANVLSLRDELTRSILEMRQARAAQAFPTTGDAQPEVVSAAGSTPNPMVEEIKRQIQNEMGLLPVRLLRQRRDSFVELNAYDTAGKSSYGTAGYLGNGYFITVKHAVVSLDEPADSERRISSITVRVKGKDLPARLVDTGDAKVEVDAGDWAILHVRGNIGLPALHVNTGYSYDFAEPIFRLGNDYSKGIILSTGYVGQRTANGLVTALTDGHPGVSGGGVLDQAGDLVGIPIGRMQGDYRFSFILPVRGEMLRAVAEPRRPATATN